MPKIVKWLDAAPERWLLVIAATAYWSLALVLVALLARGVPRG